MNWINNITQESNTKIEQLGTGYFVDWLIISVTFCKLINIIYPNKIKIEHMIEKPKNEIDSIKNFKLINKCL